MRIALALMTALTALHASDRPSHWAEKLDLPGLPNLHRVAPHVYRCGQPTAEGLRNAEALGIRTVINLRDFNDDEDEAEGTKLRLITVDMNAWRIKNADVALALAALRDEDRGPFLVHCHHGADRTGVVLAMFRMVEQGWTRKEAIHEMREGGYGFHRVWLNITRYLERADLEKMRKRVDFLARRSGG